MKKKNKYIKLVLLVAVLSIIFLNVGCSKSGEVKETTENYVGEEDKSTLNNDENDTNDDEQMTINNYDNVEEICEFLVDKTWYSEIEEGVDTLFYYWYNELTFHSDGTFEWKEHCNLKPNEREANGKWSVSEDKILEIYFAADDIDELVWGDVTSNDTWKWKIDGDTLKLYGDNYSQEEPKLPDFNEVFVTEQDDIKEQLVNNAWIRSINGNDKLYEFSLDGTLMITDYSVYGDKENYTGYWNLSSDNALQISINGSEMMSYKLLSEDVCMNQNGDFSYFDPYWWIESNENFIVGDLLDLERFDEEFYGFHNFIGNRIKNYINYNVDNTFYTDELLNERDNILQTEPYITIKNNEISDINFEHNIATIYLADGSQYQFEVESDKNTRKISKITYIAE